MKGKNAGLYIHIPFCRSKCPYCDFYSLRLDESASFVFKFGEGEIELIEVGVVR